MKIKREHPTVLCVSKKEVRNAGSRMTAVLMMAASFGAPAIAMQIDSGNPDVKINWDTNLKYSSMFRLKDASPELVAAPDFDDGNRNFKKGLVSNRVDVLTEVDVTYQNLGLRVSGAAWYDDVYNRTNDNNSPSTNNSLSVGPRQFTTATEKLHGRQAELLDAFVFGRFDASGMPLTVRLGKHTLVYGETLFFGGNGIAAAQGPVDAVKALSVPNTQFKELLMPVNQVSGQLQLNSEVTLGSYYQFSWKSTRLPGAGSYFSSADFVGAGAESLAGFPRASDTAASDHGQGGMQLRWRPQGGDAEYGFYAVRYHDKTPQVYLNPVSGNYRLVYPEGIKAYGASVSTVLGDANVAAELSFRDNMPLASGLGIDVTGAANNSGNPLYAVGRTAHLNLSAIKILNGTQLFDSAAITAEMGWNRLMSITKNPGALNPNTDREALGFRFIFEPSYYQVLPGLDVSVPVGLGYNVKGRSAVLGAGFNGGVDRGGDVSIGIKGEYKNKVRMSLNYNHFFGPTNTGTNFGQTLKDRDYLSLSAQFSF